MQIYQGLSFYFFFNYSVICVSFFSNLHFEKAYCLYRVNNHNEALKIIDGLGADVGYHLKELKAQILYRIENYGECAKVYRDIIKNTSDEYEDERQTNLTAAMVFLDKAETVSWKSKGDT